MYVCSQNDKKEGNIHQILLLRTTKVMLQRLRGKSGQDSSHTEYTMPPNIMITDFSNA